MIDNRAIIADLARAKAAFQLRAIVAAMGLPSGAVAKNPPKPLDT